MTIALVCPDAFSVLLFCPGIIASLQQVAGARVLVVTEVGPHQAELAALGVDIADVPISRFVDPVADLKYLWRLRRVFRESRCEIVLNFSTKPNLYGTIAARLAGVRHVVSHVVGRGAAFLPGGGLQARVVRGAASLLYRVTCRWSDKLWFTNQNDVRFFIERGLLDERKAVVTRNYLDTSRYRLEAVDPATVSTLRRDCGVGPGDVVVVMVARMIWAKGIREFAEAACALRVSHPHAVFLLVAPLETGSEDAVPESYIREIETRSRLQWLGFLPDVLPVYALSDIAVLPSYYLEGGYPRALLEPMSMGKPIVTTDTDGCRGTVDPGFNGILVPERDSAALAHAVAGLIDDPARRAQFGRNARVKAVRDFDETAIVSAALADLGIMSAHL